MDLRQKINAINQCSLFDLDDFVTDDIHIEFAGMKDSFPFASDTIQGLVSMYDSIVSNRLSIYIVKNEFYSFLMCDTLYKDKSDEETILSTECLGMWDTRKPVTHIDDVTTKLVYDSTIVKTNDIRYLVKTTYCEDITFVIVTRLSSEGIVLGEEVIHWHFGEPDEDEVDWILNRSLKAY